MQIFAGTHGASARTEAARRSGQDARRWLIGARAEERTGRHLDRLTRRRRSRSRRVVVLADRAVPGTAANIDHLAVTPGGVWIIDTKAWAGRPQRRDGTLTVGARDVRDAVASLAWVRARVRRRLDEAGFNHIGIGVAIVVDSAHRVPVWTGDGCAAGDARRISSLIGRRGPVGVRTVEDVAGVLAGAFPPHPG